ncbi:MAG: hypothetical protein HY537_04750, partial [Deltaproteobacteria bacterium]|nr:hypothetical protein [Deltaproteobacteria bacterium]
MRLVHILFLVVLPLINSAWVLAEDSQYHAITKPRILAPNNEKVGLRGELIWNDGFLYLHTPSNKMYRIRGRTENEKQLKAAVDEKGNHVELSGVLRGRDLLVSSIESITTASQTNAENARSAS